MSALPFHPIIAEWFTARFVSATNVQMRAWPAIQSGRDVLISAPTGSGKTLAAFLSCIDTLFQQAVRCELRDETQVLYVSPLKALSNDVQKNLQQPLSEIGQAALASGLLLPERSEGAIRCHPAGAGPDGASQHLLHGMDCTAIRP